MVFNSVVFLVFFTVVCILMLITKLEGCKKLFGAKVKTLRHGILLIASYVFYGYWDWRFACLMLGMTVIAYICSLQYDRTHSKFYIWVSVVVPLVILGFFKYYNFFVSSFAEAFGISNIRTLRIILPVGISFYTFQSLSYSVDVFRGKIQPEKSLLKLSVYISFFPQLVAGPIVKAGDFLPQLEEDRNISWKNFQIGIQYFFFGMFKKIVIADNLSVCVDAVFNTPSQYHAISLIFAIIAYSIQIYCDFSGYSDMAIGCSKCLGYDLQRNFNLPYISANVSEFWKRWHISLSSWLMEYVYIPLGGNRRGHMRTYLNLFITMLLGGLWHGASWTFVVWGALHGVALCAHKLWQKWLKRDKNYRGTVLGRILAATLTYGFVCFCWIFFRADTFACANKVITGIFTWRSGIVYISSWTVAAMVIVAAATLVPVLKAAIRSSAPEGFYPLVKLNTVSGLTVFFVFVGFILILFYSGGSPFIYFQF